MSKYLSLLFIILTIFCLSACAKPTKSGGVDVDNQIKIITTIFAPYDFAREITGGSADITMLLPPGSESHSYEPTPEDIIKIQKCDVFICTGGESDWWVEKILNSIDTSDIQIIKLMDCVDLVEEEIAEGMESGGDDIASDEHVWTSPLNAKRIVNKISGVLYDIDSENAEFYRQNTVAYLAELDELDNAFRELIKNSARKILVFGDRFPFRYLTDIYGLEYYAAFPGCSSESEPSPKTVAFLIDKIKDDNIPVVLHIELSNMKMAETISEATGVKILLLHSCHNISRTDFENGITYLELMNNNIESLREALY